MLPARLRMYICWALVSEAGTLRERGRSKRFVLTRASGDARLPLVRLGSFAGWMGLGRPIIAILLLGALPLAVPQARWRRRLRPRVRRGRRLFLAGIERSGSGRFLLLVLALR